ncbi:hypothetical protein [Nocardioides alcanivorans]|uniref:hypothetical protein n=1 Tax=Nocardioides alcanivorans TaxID=2897352 RepID=UPI001F200BF0|nr:hypothetical protein [Nocardioides alcanivorans]
MTAASPRLLTVEIDGEEKSAELTNGRFNAADAEADTVTFKEAREGGAKDWFLAFSAVQDTATGSIWSEIFDNAGDEVPIVYMPHGNAVPSVAEPHFTATAIIAAPDGDFLGGDANANPTARWTFEAQWKLKAKPVRVTTP